MLAFSDIAGFVHFIPRERLISISLMPVSAPDIQPGPTSPEQEPAPPSDAKAKLVVLYSIEQKAPGQLTLFFNDDSMINHIRQTLRGWALQDHPNFLEIFYGNNQETVEPTDATPSASEGIGI